MLALLGLVLSLLGAGATALAESGSDSSGTHSYFADCRGTDDRVTWQNTGVEPIVVQSGTADYPLAPGEEVELANENDWRVAFYDPPGSDTLVVFDSGDWFICTTGTASAHIVCPETIEITNDGYVDLIAYGATIGSRRELPVGESVTVPWGRDPSGNLLDPTTWEFHRADGSESLLGEGTFTVAEHEAQCGVEELTLVTPEVIEELGTCEAAGSVTPVQAEGVIWSPQDTDEFGNIRLVAAPAEGYRFPAEFANDQGQWVFIWAAADFEQRTEGCDELTYTYTAEPVCFADVPHVRFTATGTGDVYVVMSPNSQLVEAGTSDQIPWQNISAQPLPTTEWEAIRTDTYEVFDTGSFTLTEDNPCATVPDAPTGLTVTGGNGTIAATWTAPANNGGSSVTGYKVGISPDGVNFTTLSQGTATSRTFNLSQRGTRFYVRVQAVNAVGDSTFSTVQSAVTWNVPSLPRSLTAVPTNVSGQVRLSWLLPATNGGAAITDYIIQRSPNGTSSWTTVPDGVSTARTYTVTGLTNGTRYYFRVLAKNVTGNSASSNVANAIPRTKPSAPRSLTTTPGNGHVTLRWLAPTSNGGAAVTDYVIQRYVSGGSWVTINDGVRATTSYTVTGLRNGTRYYFRVFAKNAAGTGAVSNTVNTIPRTVPSAPRLRAYPASGRVLLTWTPPASNGGAAITRYAIQRSTSPTSGWAYISTTTPATSRSFNATGLRNGTRYYFRIAAINAAGVGTWSPVISAVPSARAGSGYYFANCTAVRQAGAAPLQHTQAGYRTALDADRDGVACE